MTLIDGRAIAAAITAEVTETAAKLRESGTAPTLAVLVPTDDDATAWYVRSIERAAKKVGVDCRVVQLEKPTGEDVTRELDELSADPSVHGIICQTPLPEGVTLDDVGAHIDPRKDVDGANPVSLGRLTAGLPTYAPATAAAVLEILKREQVALSGAQVAVVGRSTVVGKPAALLLLGENATVTVCHSRTKDLAAVTKTADVLVVAVGRAHFIGADHVKPGAVVIDVGTNPTPEGGLVGDVDQAAVEELAGSITPVPGGVGPVTTSLLLRHTVTAAQS
ncbi:bifunctional 5,10-methylenetetrahydrofolate dehydrogenase/5,10-methenyltetrahydrofolate cyclohydrolase [Amycolatopsis regifaucium]|uniref:Bifunctional protein FolD n=1 Tax=Amycolatopsis regifaucium TaxID=546365 RepID=A0A154MP56_9PSEU|nr:bifunctional 5,10-methylenetetrahydrofolate dehydrogenase/5,10-methenyltetrahydrofolate cyclohydrolase [Amycolatopsis regifaucium]KZB86035.1 bifunctional 5,10-methylene-tetrahydrofolate dehydrogenase/5,10-methylene-tetrahydrofolate cyclohydrolase [Amycolatopsis regifaucium]OKA04926.1 bifunctional 5,10-methylene-tetrahydrofolate dehydrogenase/5,10-methylene-tetrahydrofolate cyclohydrolase [Amycolatopsis regifaucium]SFH75376.1 methylenetetrahydrofolate dehydrogenase (NADP+) / methenyltetrahydro